MFQNEMVTNACFAWQPFFLFALNPYTKHEHHFCAYGAKESFIITVHISFSHTINGQRQALTGVTWVLSLLSTLMWQEVKSQVNHQWTISVPRLPLLNARHILCVLSGVCLFVFWIMLIMLLFLTEMCMTPMLFKVNIHDFITNIYKFFLVKTFRF